MFHDFGAAGVVRDVNAAGDRVVAVVGGRVAFSVNPRLGPTQWDSGGVLHVLDLEGSDEVVLETPERLYRRPALSPDGTGSWQRGSRSSLGSLIADTTVSKNGDIYLFGGE